MRYTEIKEAIAGFKVKNNITFMPLDQWLAASDKQDVDEGDVVEPNFGRKSPYHKNADIEVPMYDPKLGRAWNSAYSQDHPQEPFDSFEAEPAGPKSAHIIGIKDNKRIRISTATSELANILAAAYNRNGFTDVPLQRVKFEPSEPTKPKSHLHLVKEMDEALKLDTPHRRVSDPEMADYLSRVKSDALRADVKKLTSKTNAQSKKTLKKWKDAPAQRTDKEKTKDYYTAPHVHGSSVQFMDNGQEIDLDHVRQIITTRPKTILKQNAKMQKSGVYFNTRLPALKGLAVDEETGEFIFVDTCPGAGACQSLCYAKGGFYVVFKGVWEGMSQLLNFLINDPAGFEAKLSEEIEEQRKIYEPQGITVNVRWHDAGDFFSDEYMQMAVRIANKFPTVKFYAYTKMGKVATAKLPNNFDTNWSEGATSDQRKVIRIHQDQTKQRIKHSEIVPRDLFRGMLDRVQDPTSTNPKDKVWAWKPGQEAVFKQKLATKYNLDPKSILSYAQMDKIKPSQVPQYNVYIVPGEPDTSANRRDVIGTYLLQH